MTASAISALSLAVIMVATGLACVWIGRAGQRRTLDWAWGFHTAEETDPAVWDEAHQVAAPHMIRAGWLLAWSGILGASLMYFVSETAGGVVLTILAGASVIWMFVAIAAGLKVLNRPATSI